METVLTSLKGAAVLCVGVRCRAAQTVVHVERADAIPELAQRMHGEIRLKSRPGRTAFTFELPTE